MIHEGRDSLTARVIRRSNSSPWGVVGQEWKGSGDLWCCFGDMPTWRGVRIAGSSLTGQPWALPDLSWHFPPPPPFAHPCCRDALLWRGSQTSHQCSSRLSRPWANSLWKQLFLILASPEAVVHRQCSSWQWTWAALWVSYKILLVSTFKLGALPWQKKQRGKAFFALT